MPSTDPSVLDRIVKAYDVRGTTPDQLNADVAHALGVARFGGDLAGFALELALLVDRVLAQLLHLALEALDRVGRFTLQQHVRRRAAQARDQVGMRAHGSVRQRARGLFRRR